MIDRFSRYYISVVSEGLFYRNYEGDEMLPLVKKPKYNIINTKHLAANDERSMVFYKSANTVVTVIYDLNRIAPSTKDIDISKIIPGNVVEIIPYIKSRFFVITDVGHVALLHFDTEEFFFVSYKSVKPIRKQTLGHNVRIFHNNPEEHQKCMHLS